MLSVGEVEIDPTVDNNEDWTRKRREWLRHLCSSSDSQHSINIDVKTGRMNGIIKNGEEVIEVKENESISEYIIGNLKNHLTQIQRGDGDVILSERNDIVDLGADGSRWEGQIYANVPFGYGSLYNEDNALVYEGWLINTTKVCYGIEYWSDLGTKKYEGNYYEGLKHGYGVLYDRLGKVEYSGFFNNDSPATIDKELILQKDIPFPFLHSHLETFSIGSEYNPSIRSLLIHDCYSLKHIHFGSYSLSHIESLELKRNCR